MAAFFMFLIVVFAVIVTLNNRVVKRSFDVAESTLNQGMDFIQTSGPKIVKSANTAVDLLQIGVNAAADSATQAYFQSLEERYGNQNKQMNLAQAKAERQMLLDFFNK